MLSPQLPYVCCYDRCRCCYYCSKHYDDKGDHCYYFSYEHVYVYDYDQCDGDSAGNCCYLPPNV